MVESLTLEFHGDFYTVQEFIDIEGKEDYIVPTSSVTMEEALERPDSRLIEVLNLHPELWSVPWRMWDSKEEFTLERKLQASAGMIRYLTNAGKSYDIPEGYLRVPQSTG